MIGSGIGATFDTIQGRKVGEMSSPRAQEGEPIPLVFGTARVTGRLMSCGEPSIVEEGGKGGPQVVNETAYLSYSILVCESSELRDSTIGGILMVIQNNKIVYDVRPNPAISAADSAKWKQNKVFYFGGEGQGVDPTEQMIHGVGNVPAYRGLCRMVVTDEDVTQHGGGIPAYEFVVSRCPVEPPHHILVTGDAIDSGGPMWAAARTGDSLTFTGLTQASGADIPRGTPGFRNNRWVVTGDEDARISFDNRETWGALPNTHHGLGYPRGDAQLAPGPAGWLMTNPAGPASAFDKTAKASPIEDGFSSYAFSTGVRLHGEETSMCRYTGGYYYTDGGAQGELSRSTTLTGPWETIYDRNNTLSDICYAFWDVVCDPIDPNVIYACGRWNATGGGVPTAQVRKGEIVDGLVTFPDLLIETSTGDETAPLQLESGGGTTLALSRGERYVWTSEDSFASAHSTGIGSDRTSNVPQYAHQGIGRRILYSIDENKFYLFSGRSEGTPELGDKCVTTEDGLSFSEPASLPIQNVYGATISTAFEPSGGGIIIPDAPGYEIDPITGEVIGPENNVANACGMTLQEIFDHLDNLAGIPSGNRDSDAVADIIVPGYAIDSFMTVAEAKEPLRQIYRVACPEYDDKIRYRLYGLATDFVVDPDDLILTDEPTEKGVRGQTVEFPRRLHVQYVDANVGYKPMKQTAERISPDIRVKGELVSGANITLEADTAKQAADIGLKVAWTEREDSREFALPIDYFAETIPAHTFTLDGRRYRITDMRLDAGAVHITSVYDRISAYQSNAVGTVGPRPTPPPSQVRGPTISAVLNAPVLRDADDKAGIYWAGCGPMEGWQGARLQVSRDNGATWENGPLITAPAVMGELTATLPAASRYAQDNTNTLAVTMYREETLDSTAFEGLMEERNVFAIQYPDGTVEIGQFETATEIAERQWELTGLMRGRQDTVAGEHLAGAKFVLLNDAVRFVAIRPDDVGKTLKFRAVSLGTDPDAAEVQGVTFTTIESLREWQPYNVVVTPDGLGGFCVEWIGRARLGSSRTPIHSQWFLDYEVKFDIGSTSYLVHTTDQAICVSAATLAEAFPAGYSTPAVTVRARSKVATNDDDFDSPPSPPVTPTTPITSTTGGPGSTSPGPNGGYADDMPYPIPAPTVFGLDVIDDGDFTDPASLAGWRDRLGNPLASDWEVTAGKAQYSGSAGTAYGYAWRMSISPQPFPRYSITVTAKVQTTGGQTARVGVAWGTNTSIEPGSDVPNNIEADAAASYLTETTVSYTWELQRQFEFITAFLYYGHVNFMPVVQFAELDGAPEVGTVDDATMAIAEVPVPTTPIPLDHLDFDTGLADWELWPAPSNPYAATVTAAGGELSMIPTHELAKFANAYCVAPIDAAVADAVGKYIVIEAEVWCNDPSVDLRGRTSGGAHMYLAPNTITDGYAKNSVYVAQRGDWTVRRWWYRISTVPSGSLLSYHVCAQMRCALGYSVKVRNITAAITDSVMD